MANKGMLSIFSPKHPSSATSSPSHHSSLHSTPSQPFYELRIDEDLSTAEQIILKWDPNGSNYSRITSLWHESRKEAGDFIQSVRELQKLMQYIASTDSNSQTLVRSQNLMQIAMKRLEKEFYQILSVNRAYLDPESISGRASGTSVRSNTSDYDEEISDDDQIIASESISQVERVSNLAMSDLRSIAECMIFAGYGKECVKIYNIVRKSIIDEGLYHLGIERMSFSQVQKLNWDVTEMKIKSWLNAMKVAVRTLFFGEQILCDHVFSASDAVRESCFNKITRDGAMLLFEFPEHVAKCKKSPEKIFLILDLYDSLSEFWPEIETIFWFESSSGVRSQVVSSMVKLGESVRAMLQDFESAIHKDLSKAKVPSGGLHPLSRYVMNYLSFLADYQQSLTEITADWPLEIQNPLPEDYYFDNSDDRPSSLISARLAWLILVLLCKLDGKAELYKDVPLTYLFLMNNLQYIVEKVRDSNLRSLLGDEWISKHDGKVRQYASNYEKTAWSKVTSSLQNNSLDMDVEAAKQFFRRFNSAFEEAYRLQASWVVPDRILQDELKISITQSILPAYGRLYGRYSAHLRGDRSMEVLIRFSPEDLRHYLSDLFYGTAGESSANGGSSSSSSHSHS